MGVFIKVELLSPLQHFRLSAGIFLSKCALGYKRGSVLSECSTWWPEKVASGCSFVHGVWEQFDSPSLLFNIPKLLRTVSSPVLVGKRLSFPSCISSSTDLTGYLCSTGTQAVSASSFVINTGGVWACFLWPLGQWERRLRRGWALCQSVFCCSALLWLQLLWGDLRRDNRRQESWEAYSNVKSRRLVNQETKIRNKQINVKNPEKIL